jgi:hypothetical protein
MSVTLAVTPHECVGVGVQATVMASGPMTVDLTYTITGYGSGSVTLTFTSASLTQTQSLPDGDATVDGSAHASAGAASDDAVWVACTPPSTTDPPTATLD